MLSPAGADLRTGAADGRNWAQLRRPIENRAAGSPRVRGGGDDDALLGLLAPPLSQRGRVQSGPTTDQARPQAASRLRSSERRSTRYDSHRPSATASGVMTATAATREVI